MPALKDISIKWKLQLIIMFSVVAALALACGAFLTYDLVMFQNRLETDLSVLADLIGQNSTAALSFNDTKAAREILADLKGKPNIVAAAMYASSGKVFATYRRDDSPGSFPPSLPRSDEIRFGPERLTLFRQITLDQQVIGGLYLESDLQQISARLHH